MNSLGSCGVDNYQVDSYLPNQAAYPNRPKSNTHQSHMNLYHYIEGQLCPARQVPSMQLQEEFGVIKDWTHVKASKGKAKLIITM